MSSTKNHIVFRPTTQESTDSDADILSKLGFSGLSIDEAEGVETWEVKANTGSYFSIQDLVSD